ncbi:MAG: hypothetical protein QM734_04870 [Cyclobacteriaceae bacterium]
MKFISVTKASFLFLLVIGLWSCGSKKERLKKILTSLNKLRSLTDNQDVAYNIPSPSEIPYLLQATGAEFNQGLIQRS